MDNSRLIKYLDNKRIFYKKSSKTAELVSFKVGGECALAVFPKSIIEFVEIISLIKNEKFVVLGKGTNTYFTSDFYDGIVVVTSGINQASFCGNVVLAECGAPITSVCKLAGEQSLGGMEFAYGIPGSIGGAVCMNASAYGSSFSQIVQKSTVLEIKSGKIFDIDKTEHFFSTKNSIFLNKELCILKTVLLLECCDKDLIFSKMNEYFKKRQGTQPLNMPSAGSTFVKPQDTYASMLIDKAGLKGFTIGGAQVSTKHAGFIVNLGNATSYDVQRLIMHIKNTILALYNIELKEEIIYLE